MPFHFCGGLDDLIYIPLYLLAMLPFVGVFFRRFHVWFHARFNLNKHKETDCHHHLDGEAKVECEATHEHGECDHHDLDT